MRSLGKTLLIIAVINLNYRVRPLHAFVSIAERAGEFESEEEEEEAQPIMLTENDIAPLNTSRLQSPGTIPSEEEDSEMEAQNEPHKLGSILDYGDSEDRQDSRSLTWQGNADSEEEDGAVRMYPKSHPVHGIGRIRQPKLPKWKEGNDRELEDKAVDSPFISESVRRGRKISHKSLPEPLEVNYNVEREDQHRSKPIAIYRVNRQFEEPAVDPVDVPKSKVPQSSGKIDDNYFRVFVRDGLFKYRNEREGMGV